MNRYHPFLDALHWLLAVSIITGLIMGTKVLSAAPNDVPEKLFYLKMHMTMGLVILVLMTVRLAVRFRTEKPTVADIGNKILNKLG